jgi:hypothetical protein
MLGFAGPGNDFSPGLTGPERVVTATTVALQRLQADPLAKIMRSMVTIPGDEWVTDSPTVNRFAIEMVGLSTPDPLAAQWLIRTFLTLWYWPLKDVNAEAQMVRRFLGPPYAVGATAQTSHHGQTGVRRISR